MKIYELRKRTMGANKNTVITRSNRKEKCSRKDKLDSSF